MLYILNYLLFCSYHFSQFWKISQNSQKTSKEHVFMFLKSIDLKTVALVCFRKLLKQDISRTTFTLCSVRWDSSILLNLNLLHFIRYLYYANWTCKNLLKFISCILNYVFSKRLEKIIIDSNWFKSLQEFLKNQITFRWEVKFWSDS